MKYLCTIRDKRDVFHQVFTTECEGRHLYHARTNSGKTVARFSYQEGEQSVSSMVITKYQRRGIASAMYDMIQEDQNIELKPSKHLTESGKMFWENRKLMW